MCGITPYDSTHLGHANTYLAYDLLIRRLEDLGHRVRMVRNITDVDDSILPKASELGVDFLELAAAEVARFHCDMEDLNTRAPEAEPRATEWVTEMVALIEDLVAAGHAYTVEGTTWFDVSTWSSFGRLGGYDDDTMRTLSAERGGTPTTAASATRWTSCCGSRRHPTSRRGTRRSGRAAPAGTSSAAPCRWDCSAPASTCTAAAAI